MQSKVKFVARTEMFVQGDIQSQLTGHATRRTATSAVCYDGNEVLIDEDDIRSFFNQSRITDKLVEKLSNSLHNKYVEYAEGSDGMLWLKDGLDKYIK